MNNAFLLLVLAGLLLIVSLSQKSFSLTAPHKIDSLHNSATTGKQSDEEIFKVSPSPSSFIESLSTPDPTAYISPSLTPQPLREPASSLSAGQLLYPNAYIVEQTGDRIVLESSDDIDSITEWYKTKISNSNLNIKNFIQSKTNDIVVNTLTGLNQNQEVRIELRKDTNQLKVKISVSTRNFNAI